jgi:hypothetical protein
MSCVPCFPITVSVPRVQAHIQHPRGDSPRSTAHANNQNTHESLPDSSSTRAPSANSPSTPRHPAHSALPQASPSSPTHQPHSTKSDSYVHPRRLSGILMLLRGRLLLGWVEVQAGRRGFGGGWWCGLIVGLLIVRSVGMIWRGTT